MAPTDMTTEEPFFTGRYRHAIDPKFRVTVPAAWRFAPEAELFLMPNSAETCLKALPKPELMKLFAEAENAPGEERPEILRMLGSSARGCRLDKGGRLVIPEDLCEAFELTGEVMLAGANRTFEIWNAARFDASEPQAKAVARKYLSRMGL